MATPQERLQELRGRKRLAELRARKQQVAAPTDPRMQLQDLLIKQSQGDTTVAPQIAALRAQTGDVSAPSEAFKSPGLLERGKAVANIGINLGGQVAGGAVGLLAEAAGIGEPGGLLNFGIDDEFIGANIIKATTEFAKSLNVGQDDPRVREFEEGFANKMKVLNFPAAGFAGVARLATGGGLAESAALTDEIIETGPSKAAGELAFEITGNPGLATGVETAVAGVTAGAAIRKIGQRAAARPPTDQAFKFQGAKKREIGRLLREGGGETATATSKLGKSLLTGADKVIKDKLGFEAVKQGVAEGIVSKLKVASNTTKRKLSKMLEFTKTGKSDIIKGIKSKPSEVAGKSLNDRFQKVRSVNVQAGKQIDRVARGLKGTVDQTTARKGFVEGMADLGITFRGNNPIFEGSRIGNLRAPQRIIRDVIAEIRNKDLSNPRTSHEFKQFLDEQLKAGKSAKGGLTGKTINIIENLRKNIDDAMDAKFPTYDAVNKTFSSTKKQIDALQDLVGKKVDLMSETSNIATGKVMSRIMSNLPSQSKVMSVIEGMDELARKHGGKFDDDLILQTLFVDELEQVFKSAGRSTLKKQAQGDLPPTTLTGAANRAGGKALESLKNINEEAAFKAIQELLRKGKENGQ